MSELNGEKHMLKDLQLEHLDIFFGTAYERHKIHIKKEAGQVKPWTSDTIFQHYRFCNVSRRIDKTTIWIVENVFMKHKDDPNLWKYIFLCRYINNIKTLTELEKCETFKAKYLWLRNEQANKRKIFGSAFIVNSKGQGGTWQDKVSYLFSMILYFEKINFDNIGSIEEMFNVILPASGVGNFMAYQYTMDFTYTDRYLCCALDFNTFTVLGIGAVRGMNRILSGFPKGNKIKGEVEIAQEILFEWNRWVEKKRLSRKKYIFFYNLQLCDVEHWLCEFDKWCRGGSKKRRFSGV